MYNGQLIYMGMNGEMRVESFEDVDVYDTSAENDMLYITHKLGFFLIPIARIIAFTIIKEDKKDEL